MSYSPIKLIVGLGNPGEQYVKTRHNAGFLFIEELARQVGGKLKIEKQCFGRTDKVLINNHPVRLLAPETFMNLSGKSVVATCAYYHISMSEVLVAHDELDIDIGIARLKLGGGHGGNNGLRDIIQKASTNDFARLRLGIGHPGVGRDVSAYVLKRPNRDDEQKMIRAIDEALRVIDFVVAGEMPLAMNELHTNLSSKHTANKNTLSNHLTDIEKEN